MLRNLSERDVDAIRAHSKDYEWNQCVGCGSFGKDHRVENYDAMWHDGDVYCNICDSYVRSYDAG